MRPSTWAFVLASTALLPAQKQSAVDLAAAKKPLTAEPKYENPPRYLVMAFGQPVHRVVWLVVDGTTLWADRDGDGRLDAAKERFAPKVEKHEDHFVAESHEYAIGELPAVQGSPAYPDLKVTLCAWNLRYEGKGDMREVMEVLRADPSLRNPTVNLVRKDKPAQFAMTEFSAAPATATVLHFDGPTTWGLVENLVPLRFTPGEQCDFKVSLGTPGLGPWSFVYTMSKERKDLRPEVAATFEVQGKVQPAVRTVLPEWC
jgi:hypothetical protein